MESFIWKLPTKIVFGAGSVRKVGRYAKEMGGRAMIVIGRGSVKKLGYLELVTSQLEESGVEWFLFEGVEPNPRVDTIDRGGRQAADKKADFILALGGGSVMDAAKGMALVAVNSGSVWEYTWRGEKASPPKRFSKALPLMCIPTLAATGSEADAGAVITKWDTHEKVVLHGEPLFPKIAIVDPKLTVSVSKDYTIDGAIDIITHVAEEYLTSKVSAEVPDAVSEALAASVVKALPEVLKNPEDIDARSTLSWASTLALCGVLEGRDGSWPIHAVEHVLSGYYDISHGRGLAAVFPAFLKNTAEAAPGRAVRWVENVLKIRVADAKEAVDAWIKWMKDVGAYTRLSDLGIDDSKLKLMAKDVIRIYGKGGLLRSPVPLDVDGVESLLREIM